MDFSDTWRHDPLGDRLQVSKGTVIVRGLDDGLSALLLLKLQLIKMQNDLLSRLLYHRIRIVRNGIQISTHASKRVQFSDTAEIFFVLFF